MVWATPAWERMPTPITEIFHHIGIGQKIGIFDLIMIVFQDLNSAFHIGFANSEGQIRAFPVRGNGLYDHIHIDAGIGQRAKDMGGDTRLIGYLDQGDLGFIAAVGDAGDDLFFHDFILCNNQGAGQILETGQDLEGVPRDS